jgi:hypothetical protein
MSQNNNMSDQENLESTPEVEATEEVVEDSIGVEAPIEEVETEVHVVTSEDVENNPGEGLVEGEEIDIPVLSEVEDGEIEE